MSSRWLHFAVLCALFGALATGFGACVCVSTTGNPTGSPATGVSATPGTATTVDLKSASPAADEGPPADGGSIVVHLEAEPPHLNYLLQPDAWMMRMINHHVYQMLLRENPYDYKMEGELAESWEVSDDKLTWTFHLRKDVKWDDGQPFTSADVQFTFDKVLKDETAAVKSARETLKPYVKSTEAPDPSTFVLHGIKPYAFLDVSLANDIPILPKHVFEKGDFNKHPANFAPVGTGPYKFDHWDHGKEIVYVKSPTYWGKTCAAPEPHEHCKGHLDKLVFKYVADRYTAFNLTKAGEIDVLERLMPEMVVKELTPEVLAAYTQVSYYPASFTLTAMNLNRPYFSDARVRKAFAHLWNSVGIIKDLEFGLAKPIFGPYWLESASLHPSLKPYEFDPAKAAALFAEAGWADTDKDGLLDKGGVKMSFDFLFSANSKTLAKILTYVKNDFVKAGVELNVTPIEWALMQDRLKAGKFDMTSFIWILPTPKSTFASLYHSRFIGGGLNYGSYRSPKADALLDEIDTTFDDGERVRLEHELQELLYEDEPSLFTQCTRIDSLVSKRFRNVRASLKWFQLEDWWSPLADQRK